MRSLALLLLLTACGGIDQPHEQAVDSQKGQPETIPVPVVPEAPTLPHVQQAKSPAGSAGGGTGAIEAGAGSSGSPAAGSSTGGKPSDAGSGGSEPGVLAGSGGDAPSSAGAGGSVVSGAGGSAVGTSACQPQPFLEACGARACGPVNDGCGHSYQCGSCPSPEVCGADGVCASPPPPDHDPPPPGPCESAPPSAGSCDAPGFTLWHGCSSNPAPHPASGGCLAMPYPGMWCCPG